MKADDERAIREVNAAWIDAVNAADLAPLLRLMTDDVVFLNPGQAPLARDGFPAVFTGPTNSCGCVAPASWKRW